MPRYKTYWTRLKPFKNKKDSPNIYANSNFHARDDNILQALRLIKVNKNAHILDLGCNCGRTLNYLMNNGYNNLTGADINTHAFQYMGEVYPELASNVKMIQGSFIDSLAKNNNSYDVIFTLSTLIHLDDREQQYVMEWIKSHCQYVILLEFFDIPRKNKQKLFNPIKAQPMLSSMGFTKIYSGQLLNDKSLPANYKLLIMENDMMRYDDTVFELNPYGVYKISSSKPFIKCTIHDYESNTLLQTVNPQNMIYVNRDYKMVKLKVSMYMEDKETIDVNLEQIENQHLQVWYPMIGRYDITGRKTYLLPNEETIYYLIHKKQLPRLLQHPVYSDITQNCIPINNDIYELSEIIDSFDPKSIVLTMKPHKLITDQIFKEYKSKIVYLHHGLIHNFDFIPEWIGASWDPEIRYFVANEMAITALNAAGIKKITNVKGLPQFDYIIKNKVNLQNNKLNFKQKYNLQNEKIILIINGTHGHGSDINSTAPIIEHLLANTGIKYKLIIKNKIKNELPNTDIRINLGGHHLIYDYFFADVIIVVEGGTSIVECLFDQPHKTILYQCHQEKEYQLEDMKYCIARDKEQLRQHLITRLNKFNVNPAIKEAYEHVEKVIGSRIELTSDNIIKML